MILASFGIGNLVTQMLVSCRRCKATVDVFMADVRQLWHGIVDVSKLYVRLVSNGTCHTAVF